MNYDGNDRENVHESMRVEGEGWRVEGGDKGLRAAGALRGGSSLAAM
jgi:hypothetical protein